MSPKRVRSEERLESARFKSVRLEDVRARRRNVKAQKYETPKVFLGGRQGRSATRQSINSSVGRGLKMIA